MFVSTKTALGPTAAICKTPRATTVLLSDAAEAVVRDTNHWHKRPIGKTKFEVHIKQPEQAAKVHTLDMVERISDSAFAVHGTDAAEAFTRLWSACLHALDDLPFWLR